jgi:hypothetical protein
MGFMIEHISTSIYTVFLGWPYRPYLIAQKRLPPARGPRAKRRVGLIPCTRN